MRRDDAQTLHVTGSAAPVLKKRYEELPLRDMPARRLEARHQHLLREISRSSKPQIAALRYALNRRRGLVPLAAALVIVGTAAAATTTWLTGSPAPSSVVDGFKSYPTQLGFHPLPGQAVLVASSHSASLYATLNSEGGYCLTVSAPWKRPDSLSDGGTCVTASAASAAFVAGTLGVSSSPGGSATTLVVAGRTTNPAARAVRFEGPDGGLQTQRLGSSGFFVAALETSGSVCSRGDWAPTFELLAPGGDPLTKTTVPLATDHGHGVCELVAPQRPPAS
jgi:hypothetical protein